MNHMLVSGNGIYDAREVPDELSDAITYNSQCWTKTAISLYNIIDDIDTMLDMYKGDYEAFANAVSEKVKQRHNLIRVIE